MADPLPDLPLEKRHRPLLGILGVIALIVGTAWGLRVWQGPGELELPDRSTYRVRTLHEGDHTIAPGASVLVTYDWGGTVLRMPSVPPDREPYDEMENRLEMSVSVSEGGKADLWLVSDLEATSFEGKRPASKPREAIDPFSRSGVEGTSDLTYPNPPSHCTFVLANPSDSRPVTLHFKLRRGYWHIEPQK